MARRTIPQRELRNNIGEILRQAEAGAEFTITVRGRAIARLGPLDESGRRRVDVPMAAARTTLASTPVDSGFAEEITALRESEEPLDDPSGKP